MDSQELQALATFVVRCHGAELFTATVRQAKALAGDKLAFGAVWDRIAAEAMRMEKRAGGRGRSTVAEGALPHSPLRS